MLNPLQIACECRYGCEHNLSTPPIARNTETALKDTISNAPQMKSAAYRLPALDQDFLLGDSTRGIRFQLEYQKAEEMLRKWGVESTCVVFGSARVSRGRWHRLV